MDNLELADEVLRWTMDRVWNFVDGVAAKVQVDVKCAIWVEPS